jgi:hypothetical protein
MFLLWLTSRFPLRSLPLPLSSPRSFVKTVQHEGFPALFKGLWPNYVKVVPSIAIAFVTYEQVKELLGVKIRISE